MYHWLHPWQAAPVVKVLAALAMVAVLAGRNATAEETFEGWDLEPGVGQAHLVMVARVASISRATVVEGAKTDVVFREYRFQPVKVLKGIFQRDQLSMTGADLGLAAEDSSVGAPLKEGEFRLLILAQARGNSMGCVSAAPGATTFGQRVPLLTGPDDPLVPVIETLIQVADARSRRESAALLVQRLTTTDAAAAVPLLSSLQLRADWAASEGSAHGVLAKLARNPSPAVRSGAVRVLRDMLASRTRPDAPRQLTEVGEALRAILTSDEANTGVRLDALAGLGHLLAMQPDLAGARELMAAQLTTAATHAERAAAVTALARIAPPGAVAAVMDALAGLPLDESPSRESVYARAAVRLDAARAEQVLLARLTRSLAARQSLEAEINALGRIRSKASLPVLLDAADQSHLSSDDRNRIAWALGRLNDERAVPKLIGWLRGDDYNVKEVALASLESLDSPLAAQEARPLLKTEGHLHYKLRIARLLARHGIADGYALATEHLADEEHTAAATLVLASLRDPRTRNDLSEILMARPDKRWHAAALTGLASIGDAAAQKQLLGIVADDRNPLAADAAQAAGLSSDSELLAPLAKLVQSRNKQIARAALLALRRYLSDVRASPQGLAAVNSRAMNPAADFDEEEWLPPAVEIPPQARAALAESVAALVLDPYVETDMRQEGLAVLQRLRGERYVQLLTDLADQSELEGTPILAAVQAERRRLQAVNKQP